MTETNHHTFVRWWFSVAPGWLKNRWGQRLSGTLALFANLLAEGSRLAVRSRTVQPDTPPDHLPLLGAARLLPRLPFESEASYREVLKRPWFYHPRGGSPQSVLEHLARMDELYVPGTLIPVTWAINELPSGYAIEDFVYSIQLTNVPAWMGDPYVYGVDAPPYDGSWVYGNKLPAAMVAAIVGVANYWGPKRSKLVALECTG